MKAHPHQPAADMTLRQRIALAAMQGYLSDPSELPRVGQLTCSQSVAVKAVQQADDLIAALNGEFEPLTLHPQSVL